MRKRIGQIARGKFEYAKPILTFSEEIIDFSVAKDTDETGEFVIEYTMLFSGMVHWESRKDLNESHHCKSITRIGTSL